MSARRFTLAALVLTAATALPALPQGKAVLLPDLVPVAERLNDNIFSLEKGRLLLRFPTVIANLGEGALEVGGRRVRRNGPMLAFQTLFTRRGRPGLRHPIGEFEYHPEHHHWHLLSVAEYRLLHPDGSLAAGGNKVSFCLLDTVHYDPQRPGSPRLGYYPGCNPSPTARRLKAGISVGWADVYARNLPDQYVDVTGLPPGDYILECEIDPDGLLRELTTDNNTASVPVRLP